LRAFSGNKPEALRVKHAHGRASEPGKQLLAHRIV
jgi:hypothetical protein